MTILTMKDISEISLIDRDAEAGQFLADGREALARLVKIAVEGSSGQTDRVANFLLAWWNASRDGGFDFTHLWNVDEAIVRDMLTVTAFLAMTRSYANDYGHQGAMEYLVNTYTHARKKRCRA